MRKLIAALLCFPLLLPMMADASAAISLPTVQHSLTVYFPPEDASVSQPAITDTDWTPISAQLNQKMATRSGPSTLYTEELGTVPKSTEISVFWQEVTGVSWVMVEFTRNEKLYRAYTGLKRINANGDIPVLSDKPQKAVIVPDIRPYYGPGTQYAQVNHVLRGGIIVEICCQEQGYALIDYSYPSDPEKRFRSWVPVSALKGL